MKPNQRRWYNSWLRQLGRADAAPQPGQTGPHDARQPDHGPGGPAASPEGRHRTNPSRQPTTPTPGQSRVPMPDMETALKEAMQIDGAVAVALVDYSSELALGTKGGGADFDIAVAAAGNTDVVRAKLRAL